MTPNTREQVALAPVCSSITILKKARIDPTIIPGYEREVTTHIAVALAVKSGEADAGMCVYSAAKALGLPFVPVAQELYELAFRKEHADDPRLSSLITAIVLPHSGIFSTGFRDTRQQRPVF
jgi:molybdate-binding protein